MWDCYVAHSFQLGVYYIALFAWGREVYCKHRFPTKRPNFEYIYLEVSPVRFKGTHFHVSKRIRDQNVLTVDTGGLWFVSRSRGCQNRCVTSLMVFLFLGNADLSHPKYWRRGAGMTTRTGISPLLLGKALSPHWRWAKRLPSSCKRNWMRC